MLNFETPFTERLDRTTGVTIIIRVHPERAGAVVDLCAPARLRLPPENERACHPFDIVSITAVGPADHARVTAGAAPRVSWSPGVEHRDLGASPQKMKRRPATESARADDHHVEVAPWYSHPLIHGVRISSRPCETRSITPTAPSENVCNSIRSQALVGGRGLPVNLTVPTCITPPGSPHVVG